MDSRLLVPVLIAICSLLFALAFWQRARNIAYFESLNAARRPVGPDGVVVGAGPIDLPGNPECAALLVHGFGDTPQSLRVLADALHRAGWSVHVMLLPGHARPLAEYARVGADDWLRSVRAKYAELRASYQTVVVCGISMGAALTAILAAEHPEIPAIVMLAPHLVMPRTVYWQMLAGNLLAFPLPYHLNAGSDQSIHDANARRETLGIGIVTTKLLGQLLKVSRQAQAALPFVRTRVLYLQSREDNRLSADDAVQQFARIGSADKQQRWLTGCGHIITVDYCRDEVARQVVAWFAPVLQPELQHHNTES